MGRLEIFRRVISIIGLTLGATLARTAESNLQSHQLPQWLSAALFFFIVVVIYLIFDIGAGILTDASTTVRRITLGRYFVEGTWMDVLRIQSQVMFVGLLRIEYESGQLTVSGRNFNAEGVVESSFNSDLSAFSWPRLMFKYTASRPAEDEYYLEGFAQLRFGGRNGPPLSYDGYYRDHAGQRANYSGWKLEDRNTLSRVDDPLKLTKMIREVWEANMPSQPELKPMPES